MKPLRQYLLLYALIASLGGNAAERFSSHEDTFLQDENSSQEDDDSVDYRLPTFVKPISYTINLKNSWVEDHFAFSGETNIRAKVINPTDNITLHVGNLKIITNTVSVLNQTVEIKNRIYDKVTEKYTFKLVKTLDKDTIVDIFFNYTGNLSDNMAGFYRSLYVDQKGQIKWLAATQFQATDARHAFPCFDEPGFKATFKIFIRRSKNYQSLSNMPLKHSINISQEFAQDEYEESIPMSTYLVAFIISEFHFLEKPEFKVWARPSAINQAHYALKVGTQALELLETLFGQKYTLPKMDMVALPDFAAGAMENWGLTTYRETRMLYDENESSALAQQSVASVIVHEITHMWFGNLVTPEWWGYLWLSEAFARYFQYFGTAQIEVNWNMAEQFVVEQHQTVLITDSLNSSRPLTRNVSSQSQIGTMGDTITYAKGASIVRMMSLTFGTELFKFALRDYLQNNKETGLGNPNALWEAIQGQINKQNSTTKIHVATIMNNWTTQPGYPLVSVTIDKNMVRVTQERFLMRNFFQNEPPANITWSIPLSWTTQRNPNFSNTSAQHWLSTKEDKINLEIDSKNWLIFNIQSSGFYRVKYDADGWQRIFKVLNSEKFEEIHVLNRANIVDDLLNLGRAGRENYDTVLDGLTYLKRETNYLPFKAALNGLDYLNRRFMGKEEHSLLKKFILSLIDDRRKKLGYEDRAGDDRLTVLLRQQLNSWACEFGDVDCNTIYMNKFKTWKDTLIPIKPNERRTAYCVAIRHGTSDDWEFLWQKYFNSNHANDQMLIMSALGCSLNSTILERYLLSAIKGYETTRIRKQDSKSVFSAVYNSGLFGAEYILDFVEKYHKEMEAYYNGQDAIATILSGASQYFSTPRIMKKFQDFVNEHKTKLAPIYKSLETSLKTAQYESKWYQTASQSITQWLIIHQSNSLNYRLPANIMPRKYFVSVTPHLEIGNFIFNGKVTIEADVIKDTRQIVLHSAEIEHHTVTVMANEIKVAVVNTNKEYYNFYVINVLKNLSAGTKLTIEITYTGYLNPSELRGFYKSSYINENGITRWLAATHLEPVGARKMFPCFDEPALKAAFTLQVNVPPGYEAISNTNWHKIEKISDNRMLYTFFETVEMSTYLVALAVSDFKFKSAGQSKASNTTLGVYARPNAIDQMEFASLVISPLVDFFEKKLKHNYQMPKLDMIALPDFPSGAGENWGLITYRENNLLHDEAHSPLTSKQAIRNVIAHEISHQWFGNLVTLSWWKYLWLNEGFARYFEYHAPAYVFNDTTMEKQFVVDQVHSALSADSVKSSHPLNHDVNTTSEIRSMFSTISYNKGASILRMIEKSYGEQVFYEALSNYLDDRKYNVSTPEDLYKALQAQMKKAGVLDNIKTILDTWTTQSGYPIINVTVNKNIVTLKQERFFLERNFQKKNFADTLWHIPITWASIGKSSEYNNTVPKLWMTKKEVTFNSSNSFFTLNVKQSGYYRVNYDEQYWLRLIDHLTNGNFTDIHEINRAELIDDLMNLARADYISYKIAISATMYLKRENDYLPWRAFYNNLPYLSNRFRGDQIEDLYETYLTSIIEPLYERLGFEDYKNDSYLTKLLRMYTRKWACKLNIGDCEFAAMLAYRNKRIYLKPVQPNYRSVVYCHAMQKDMTQDTYDFLWEEYLNSNVTADKLVILSSLACSQNKTILEKLLREAIKEDSSIRYQDSTKVFSNVYDASLSGMEVVMNVISNYYDDMQRYFDGYAEIKSIVSSLASRLSTHSLYEQYKNLLSQLFKKEPAFGEFIPLFIKRAEYEFNWYKRKAPIIFEKLDKLFSSNAYRLPDTFYPEYYNIHLEPDLEKGVFDGKVQIYMKVKKKTTAIILNTRDIKYSSINIYRNYKMGVSNNSKEIPLQNYTIYNASQQLRIYLSEVVNEEEQIMTQIKFSGILAEDMKGFYRSSYTDSDGKRHWLATTHFEPTYARKAFPCFDEPSYKSKFIINIKKPEDYNILSNMPVKLRINEKDGIWYRFATNHVNMSTYLVAFVISKFERADKNSTFLNVWGRREVAMYGRFAQETGKSLIKALESFTEINYNTSMPKLDLVGIPDFEMGAMENWGLATFREQGLFFNENEAPTSQKKYIITIIAHELAHMWFGNLVTCEWWEYIWLNEGFAQYFEYFASEMIFPDYNFMEQFVVYELHPALLKDAVTSARPMTYPVEIPEEISSVFDYVSYAKSASILRMIFNAFEPEVHILAIQDYLKNQSNGTARPEDLWRSFDSHASISLDGIKNVSFAEVMATWTDQSGYPVVNAVLRNYKLTLTQERFLMNKWVEDDRSSEEFYWVPYDIITSLEPYQGMSFDTKGWLGPKPKSIYINPINGWFIVNRQQTGFYRVNYDIDSWRRLIDILMDTNRFESIAVLNRAQIIDDLFNLARATYVDYDLLMNATRYLMHEKHHLPWKAFFNGLSYVYERFEQQVDEHYLLLNYVKNLISGMYDRVGFNDQITDKHLDKLNREMFLRWACKLDKTECTKTSIKLFTAWRQNSSERILPNARAAVYCTAVRNNKENWKFLQEQFLITNFASEKKIIINALGCSRDNKILQSYLTTAIEEYNIVNATFRKQDVAAVFSSVYGSSQIGVHVALDYLTKNVKRIHEYLGNWDMIVSLIYNVASHISNWDDYSKLKIFVDIYMASKYPDIKPRLIPAITTAKINLRWSNRNKGIIKEWILDKERKVTNGKSNNGCAMSLNFFLMIIVAVYHIFSIIIE